MQLHRPVPESPVLGIPRFSPMLASSCKEPFDDDGWLFEPKWDGYRCLAYLSSDSTYLESRNGKPLLPKFPALSDINRGLVRSRALLDGEMVAIRNGKVDFSYLRTQPEAVTLVLFDILWVDDVSLMPEPLEARQEMLAGVYRFDSRVVLSKGVLGAGRALFQWIKENDMEGMMAKKLGSPYLPGKRTGFWVKIRNTKESVFWVLGFAPSPGRSIGSLLLGENDGDGLRVVGRVSSGLNRDFEETLRKSLKPSGRIPAFLEGTCPQKAEVADITWVEPFFGVVVTYTEVTPDGRIRHPVFKEVAE